MSTEQTIDQLRAFKEQLVQHNQTRDEKLKPLLREWLNQNVSWVRREVIEAGCQKILTISPPPAVGGLVMSRVDPFDCMFEAPYGKSLISVICDMVDCTIGVLRDPPPVKKNQLPQISSVKIQQGYAFVAMPMNKDDHQLVDVLEAIKEAAARFGIAAERIDEVESNDRITDRILDSITKAEFVFVDLTHERPNVLFEAGFAHGLGKIPIYVARHGTLIHFDLKDYPVIIFRNMKELKDGVGSRLAGLKGSKSTNK